MPRIEQTFKNLKRPALITFVMAGDPNHEQCLSVLKALPEAGADIIELGMPFTDPAADGSVIQAAGLRALENGATMQKTLELVRAFRQDNKDTPLVLMGYANPLLAYGFEKFIADAANAGVDGLIIVDLPAEEDEELRTLAKAKNIDVIRLLTPTTDASRLAKILGGATGFLYYVSITGVTGAAKPDPQKIKTHIDEIRRQTDLPLAVGFGVRTPEEAHAMGKIADAVVVGSAIVGTISDNWQNPLLASLVATQVHALSKILCK